MAGLDETAAAELARRPRPPLTAEKQQNLRKK
jgi:hypothetical protein